MDANGTFYLLTDALGSILSDVSWSAGGASIKASQVFGPYGNARGTQGTFNTAKGFTGQYNDPLTGLDYYVSRYYDPVVGIFLSADNVQGNLQGMDPYTYVGGNPETKSDPTGQRFTTAQEPPPPPVVSPGLWPLLLPFLGPWLGVGILWATSAIIMQAPQPQASQPSANTPQPQPVPTPALLTIGCCAIFGGTAVNSAVLARYEISDLLPTPSGPQPQPGSSGQGGLPPIPPVPAASPQPCSFTPETTVTTEQGKEPIGKLQVGEDVLAYNPKTHKMEEEPILHVWIHTDHDLVDLTLTTYVPAQHDKLLKSNEVIHTNQKHPFLTEEKGFLPVGQITLGMHVLRANGTYGVVTGWKVVPGASVMYNLEVEQDHTFTVGDGQWVVHNDCGPDLRNNMINAARIFNPEEQVAHHIIPCQLQNHPLVQKAIEGGFDMNGAYNGRAAYKGDYAFRVTQEGEPGPVQWSGHPEYIEKVNDMLWQAYAQLEYNADSIPEQIQAKDAYNAVMDIIDQLNLYMDTTCFLS